MRKINFPLKMASNELFKGVCCSDCVIWVITKLLIPILLWYHPSMSYPHTPIFAQNTPKYPKRGVWGYVIICPSHGNMGIKSFVMTHTTHSK